MMRFYQSRWFSCVLVAWLALTGSSTVVAGQVTVAVNSGVLELTGTSASDQVLVLGVPQATVVIALSGTTLSSDRLFRGRKIQFLAPVSGMSVVGNGGDDRLAALLASGTLNYVGGDEVDQVSVVSSASSVIDIQTGGGNDTVEVTAGAESSVTVDLGEGDNSLIVTDSTLSTLSVTSGSGPDEFTFERISSAVDGGLAVQVNAGAGDDHINLIQCNLVAPDELQPAVFDGGEDYDIIFLSGNSFSVTPEYIGIEEAVIPVNP